MSLRRFAAAVSASTLLALAAPCAALDTDYTDHWANLDQTGWGVALTQGTNAIYTEIFHYGSDGKPTWFGGTMYRVADGHFAGALYTVSGDFYGHVPYNPAAFTATVAGSMDFSASDTNHGTFVYTINSTTVSTTVQRLTLDAISVGGNYIGAFIQDLSKECNVSGNPSTAYVASQILVTQTGSPGTINLEFRDVTSPFATFYTMSGAGTQYGRALDVPVAVYGNTVDTYTSLHLFDLRRTANGGIEGRWKTISGTSDPCVDTGRFSGVAQ